MVAKNVATAHVVKDDDMMVVVDRLSAPLLQRGVETAVPISNADAVVASSKQIKRQAEIKVHRLVCFLVGSACGIVMQVISVVLFTHMVMQYHHRRGGIANEPTIAVADGNDSINPFDTSTASTLHQVMMWIVYHLSLAVYLVIWAGMMVLAVSRVGWKCVKSAGRLQANRRTCFLKTFFFINGFVQGSLMPWIILEFFMGHPSMDVYWMPTTHLVVFFAVVFIYDWMSDDVPTAQRRPSVTDSNESDDEDDGANFLV